MTGDAASGNGSERTTGRDVRDRLRRRVEREASILTELRRRVGVDDVEELPERVAAIVAERDGMREVLERSAPAPAMLEAVVLYLDREGIWHVAPRAEETVTAEWGPELTPHETIVDAVAERGMTPFMVHSTSWRIVGTRLVLTFLVAVETAPRVPDDLEVDLVTRVELARGHATGPPPEVELPQVVEHGLRHLAWLVREDHAIHDALTDWASALDGYAPEPFRAFGGGAET